MYRLFNAMHPVICSLLPARSYYLLLAIAIVLAIAVGFGTVPGVLALGFHTMGFLAKFYADKQIDRDNFGW